MIHQFLWGCLAAACAVAGLCFLRFWRDSHERLFACFAIAFWILSLNWIVLAMLRPAHEDLHFVLMIRLAAFLLIVVGILDKNRRA
jgi:hypothetical protein